MKRTRRALLTLAIMLGVLALLAGCETTPDDADGDAVEGDGDAEETDGDGDTAEQDGDMMDGDATDGDAADGDATDGDATDGDATDGDAADGDATDGDAADGDATDGDAADGDATDGDAADGDLEDTDGDVETEQVEDDGEEGETAQNLGTNPLYSECGGFPVSGGKDIVPPQDENCRDERLIWTYDPGTETISFLNQNIWLNCCGEHEITITYEEAEGVYVIHEIDRPEGEGGRCDCDCFFDMAIDLPGIVPEVGREEPPQPVIFIRIERQATDEGVEPAVVTQGTIMYMNLYGDVLIEENIGYCDEPQAVGSNPALSDCGGFPGGRSITSECEDEMLSWSYDAESFTVSFFNINAHLNCCGDHAIEVFYNGGDGLFTIQETDAPENGSDRCFCECLFDFAIDVANVSGMMPVELLRDVTDDDQPALPLWSGTIDLTEGYGDILIQENAGECDP
ncbi:MAG: hypothetical protein C4523_03510 [Myxococcales bacterium]|nr:MAG: hypothetical protein C4523_03510 [Myxococcales bacterium]